MQIAIQISNYYTATGSTKCKQPEEKHLKFRQQLENRRAKNCKKYKKRSRKVKYDEVVQERGNRVANEMKQLLDGRSDPLEKTKSDILQLNLTSSLYNKVLTDNKELDSDFKKN